MAAFGFVWQLLKKFLAWLQGNPPGLLGLALTLGVLALFRSRNNRNPTPPEEPRSREARPSTASGRLQQQLDLQQQQRRQQQEPATSSRLECADQGRSREGLEGSTGADEMGRVSHSAAGGSVHSKLQGLRRITISLPGVLLEERELTDSATLRGPQTAALVQQLLEAVDVYMIAHVADDVGQAVVSAALEDAGLLGHRRNQLPPQRLLFCSTQPGKQSMVRQIEPELHIDADASTVQDLQRFVPQCLWVGCEGAPASGACAASLVEFFHGDL